MHFFYQSLVIVKSDMQFFFEIHPNAIGHSNFETFFCVNFQKVNFFVLLGFVVEIPRMPMTIPNSVGFFTYE